MNSGYILVKDMTKLFTKEILLYSFFDVSLKKPLRVVFVLYLFLLLLLWSLPLGWLLFPWNVYSLLLVFAPPFVLANFFSLPVWGGKSFFSWFKCQLRFAFSKKVYYDGRGIRGLNREYRVDHVYSVSRRKDFYRLFEEIERERGVLGGQG